MKDQLCTLLITFSDSNDNVKQITTAHTFSSTDPRHYPQRRRVVHSHHSNEKFKNDPSYVTVSRSTDSPQGTLGSDMIERRPTYQNNSGLRQLTIQEVHLSYKCSNAEISSTIQKLPNAGPLYVDYATVDEIPEATKMETMPYRPQHYASESSLLEAQKFNHSFDEKNYNTSNQQFIREQQHQQKRRRISNEPPPQRPSREKPKHVERFEKSYAIQQEESRNADSRQYSETLVKSMSYSRQQTSPHRQSTTFEAEPYREEGIRLYARYDDHIQETRNFESTTFTPTKRKRIEVDEERYRRIASGPPMISHGWKVPTLPKDIYRPAPRIFKDTAEVVKSKKIITTGAKKKPVIFPIEPSKREKFESQQNYQKVMSEEVSKRKVTSFEAYKKEVQKLKEAQQKQDVTVFDEKLIQSPPLPTSPPPLPPPVHLKEVPQLKVEYIETIAHEPVRPMHAVTTEFPIHEPRLAVPVTPVRLPSPQQTKSKIEEDAMKKFGEKLDILRNSKRFQHLRDPSELYSPKPQRTIEQIETIEIETEEYRRIPRIITPEPPPAPIETHQVIVENIFPRTISPKQLDNVSTTSVDEHKRHIRVEVTEEILTERIQRSKNKNVEVQSAEKETQASQKVPDVIETATETIFLPSVDNSTQFESFSHTMDSFTQHEAPKLADSSTMPIINEILTTEVITTESWTQMERRRFVDVSTQQTIPTAIVSDSSTQAEFVFKAPTPPPVVQTIEQGTEPERFPSPPRIQTVDKGTEPRLLTPPPQIEFIDQWTEPRPSTPVLPVQTVETGTEPRILTPPPQIETVEIGTEPRPLTPPPQVETVEIGTSVELIIEPVVEVIETTDASVNTDHRPTITKESSEESESQFEERIETTTTITTEEMATAEKTKKPTSSQRSTYESKYTAEKRSTTTTSAELKIASPPPKMDSYSSDYTSSITSRSGVVRPRTSPLVSGTNRVLRVVSETASVGSGVSPFGGSTAASSIRDAREREKKEMSDLNDRLASYIEKVRFLEAQNRKLAADLEFLRNRWGKDTFNVREMYESEISQAKKIFEDSNAERDRLANDIRKLQEELANYRRRYDQAHRDHVNDKGVIDELLVKLSAIESELTLLKRRIANLEDDVNAVKRENHRLLGELQRTRTDVDQETLNRIDYQNQVQTLIEELDFVRRAHEGEILDLQAMASRDTTSENREYFKNELAAAIREIRTEYEQLSNVQRTDMESWYKLKVQEIQTQSVRANMEQGYTKEEMKRLRVQLGELRGKLADLEGRNSLLEKQIEELRYQIEDDQRTYESALGDRDSQIHKIRDECQALMVELQMLLDTKQTLDAEIAIYRKMLEGEEDRAGLRQLVEQVVRTHQFRESQETETQRVLRGETSSRHSYQRSAKGNVSIQEAAADGKFIVVSNTHRSKEEPIGEWKVKRSIDHKREVVFTFPKSFVLKPGASVKIWARGNGVNNPPESLIFDREDSWGTGNNVQTILYNNQGEERATLIQRTSHATEH